MIAKSEKLASAILLIDSLRSVNYTGLSDWQGVIGDEIDQQREAKQQYHDELNELTEKVWVLVENQNKGAGHSQIENINLRKQLQEITKQLATFGSILGAPAQLHLPLQRKRNQVEKECPECGGVLTYRQRPLSRGLKALPCTNCGAKLVSTYSQIGG